LLNITGVTQEYGGWQEISSLNQPRRGHTIVTLKNGNILVCGNGAFNTSKTCEIYDIEENTWRYTDSLNVGRASYKTIILDDGRVLAIGSYNSDRSCELFDPLTETWSMTDSITIGRETSIYSVVKLLDGKVMLIGGWAHDSLGAPLVELADCEIYDPQTEKWNPATPMNFARENASAVLLQNGSVLVSGGRSENEIINSCEIYDPATDTWQIVAPMNENRNGHDAILLNNGNVFVAGSAVSFGKKCEVYDTDKNEWFLVEDMIYYRSDPAVYYFPLSEKALIIGGSYYNETERDTWEIYDLKQMRPVYSEPFPIKKFLAKENSVQLLDGSVAVIGGWEFRIIDGGIVFLTPSRRCWIFDSITNIMDEFQDDFTFSLAQNYPNPFNPSTRIEYEIKHETKVELKVYNVIGEVIEVLEDEIKKSGRYSKDFNAEGLSSGIYFYTLKTNQFSETKKMILIK